MMKLLFTLLIILVLVSVPLIVLASESLPEDVPAAIDNPEGTPDMELEVAEESGNATNGGKEPERNKVLEIITIIFVIAVFVLLYWWMPKGARKKEEGET